MCDIGLFLVFTLLWRRHFGIDMPLQLIQRGGDVTGEGKGWRNGHGWGWKKLFNIIMQEMPIPLSHLVTGIGEKSPCTFQKGDRNQIYQSDRVYIAISARLQVTLRCVKKTGLLVTWSKQCIVDWTRAVSLDATVEKCGLKIDFT